MGDVLSRSKTLAGRQKSSSRPLALLSALAARSHIMAVSLLMTLPPKLVFVFAQRYFIREAMMSGIEG